VYTFPSPITNMTYVLNTEWANYSTADRYCRSQGGFLATYYTVREQVGWQANQGCTRPSLAPAWASLLSLCPVSRQGRHTLW
jgi:hypothetical protein